MLKRILSELKEHYPFTLFGALTGIVLMMLFKNMEHETAHCLFYVFHPLHVFLSAMVTAAIYKKYINNYSKGITKFLKVLVVGYVGSILIGTLSDSIIPFWGEKLLDMHAEHVHVGFVEKWWIVNPVAIIAIVIAYFHPITKAPHAMHVLVSTWASLFHMVMAINHNAPVPYFGIFIFLFLAVWLPCRVSDIIFPMLFVKTRKY